jgi:hypothetical protein
LRKSTRPVTPWKHGARIDTRKSGGDKLSPSEGEAGMKRLLKVDPHDIYTSSWNEKIKKKK